MFSSTLLQKAESLLQTCREKKLRIVTAESCTGGLIGGCLTSVAGSSDVIERGFITYDNQSKVEILGVPQELVDKYGAVCEPVARKMAEGALANSSSDLVVSVTGIAGPGGGSAKKPVGLVHFGSLRKGNETVHTSEIFSGDRQEVRLQTVEKAIDLLIEAANT